MFRRIAIIIAVSFAMAGCYSVTPVGNGDAAMGEGLFYALPSTQICVDVTYQYYD